MVQVNRAQNRGAVVEKGQPVSVTVPPEHHSGGGEPIVLGALPDAASKPIPPRLIGA